MKFKTQNENSIFFLLYIIVILLFMHLKNVLNVFDDIFYEWPNRN